MPRKKLPATNNDADPSIILPNRVRRTQAQIDNGLRVVIRNGGSIRAAAKEMGVELAAVRSWMERHRERYAELEVEMGPELEAQSVNGFRAFVIRAEEAKKAALEGVIDDIAADEADMATFRAALARGETPDAPALRIRNKAGVLKDLSISQGIGVQKVLELTNRPTQIVEHRTPAEAFARLRALGAQIIEGTATEVAPAMLVETTAAAPVAALPSEATEHGSRNDH